MQRNAKCSSSHENITENAKMTPEQKTELKKELLAEMKSFGLALLLVLVILQIAFYKESVINVLKFGFSLIYLSLLPGFVIMLNFSQWLNRPVRIILSFPVGLAVYAIGAYYLNLIVPLNYLLSVPGVVIILAIGIWLKNNFFKSILD